jgi:glycosyltransferase involved in cell wall biosynthesis
MIDTMEEVMTMKIDLVMWTLNSERTLSRSLKSIDEAIPAKLVNRKIMIDGHSQDKTKSIGESFGWEVFDAKRVGIPYQANQALDLVSTDIFASFEHDIVLNPDWFSYLHPYMLKKNVAVVQGVRISTYPIVREIELYGVERSKRDAMHCRSHISLDNNLYKTDVVRMVGDFPTDCLISTDQFLRDQIEAKGYKWIIEPRMISNHVRSSINEDLQHVYQLEQKSKRTSIVKNSILFLYSPVRSLKMASRMKCPQIIYTYPRFRFARLKGSLQKNCKPRLAN